MVENKERAGVKNGNGEKEERRREGINKGETFCLVSNTYRSSSLVARYRSIERTACRGVSRAVDSRGTKVIQFISGYASVVHARDALLIAHDAVVSPVCAAAV